MSTDPDRWYNLAADWGFEEDAKLQHLHEIIVGVALGGRPTNEHWQLYLDASEPLVDFPDDGPRANKARAGRELVRALISLEADDPVEAVVCLLATEAFAWSQAWSTLAEQVAAFAKDVTSDGEWFQAHARFEEDSTEPVSATTNFELALDHYVDAASSELTPTQRGLLDLRIAQCYLGLLRTDAEKEIEERQNQAVASLESACAHLQSTPEFARAEALLGEANQLTWWQAAVERQQA